MKNRYYKLLALVIVLATIISVCIGSLYLYNPLNYPKGNLEDFSRVWTDFKKPIDIEAISWNKGEETIYSPIIGDNRSARFVTGGFAGFKKIEGPDYKNYISQLPKDQGPEYTVIIRQVESRTDKFANGEILLQFSFYENSNIAQIDGVHFYSMPDSFKEKLIDMFRAKH
jgi:hypothetical protein